jgi:uncharacterized protein YlzI (FlbEa/FlbD family)
LIRVNDFSKLISRNSSLYPCFLWVNFRGFFRGKYSGKFHGPVFLSKTLWTLDCCPDFTIKILSAISGKNIIVNLEEKRVQKVLTKKSTRWQKIFIAHLQFRLVLKIKDTGRKVLHPKSPKINLFDNNW